MKKINPVDFGKVAVVMGGISAEREVSLNSGKLVLEALKESGIDAHAFDTKDQPISALKEQGFTRVFNALHGGYGENGELQKALDAENMPYTGPDAKASAIAIDKFQTKKIWQNKGIPTPAFEVVNRRDDYEKVAPNIVEKLGLPVFIKPNCEGSSVATFKAKTNEEIVKALFNAAKFDNTILVESSIEGGGEYTASIAGNLDLPLIKIEPAGEFYDYHAKYIANDTQYLIPCGLTEEQEKQFKKMARNAFEALGCRHWGRVDFMVDANDEPFFLEVNTAPGMTDHSLPPKAARAIGISYRELVVEVLSLTL